MVVDSFVSSTRAHAAGGRRIFGGRDSRRQARDTMVRLVRVFPAAGAILLAAQLPAVVTHGPLIALPIVLSLGCYLAALTVARRSPRTEIVSMWCWVAGVLCAAAVPWVAGAPSSELWLLPAFSLPFAALVWPRPIALLATLIASALVTVTAFVLEPQTVSSSPATLLAPLSVFLIATVLTSVLREFDHRSRTATVTDPLTGLGNRVAMEHDLEEHVARRRRGTPLAMLVFDIDHFKLLNDRFGHAEGDAALRRTAMALVAATGDRGRVYRYGGEEFIVLLVGTGLDAAQAIGEELRAATARIIIGGEPIALSGGLAGSRIGDGFDAVDMFARADAALYRAKSEGRDRVAVAVPAAGVRARVLVPQADRTARPAVPAAMTQGRPWALVRTRLERDHLRTVTALTQGSVALGLCCLLALVLALACVPSLGWGPVIVGVVAGIALGPFARGGLRTLDAGRRGHARGMLWQAVVGIALCVAAVLLTRGPALYLLALVILPAALPLAAYRAFGGALIAAAGTLLVAGGALLVAPGLVAQDPLLLTAPVGLLWEVAIVGTVVMRSSVDHRARADVDPLTGALNRGALEARVAELAQTGGRHEPVALIVADLDRFKQINDTFGHGAGDEVLVAVAGRLQGELRVVDALYRIGGEEFVVLLTRTGPAQAERVAERLRAIVSLGEVAGCRVTVSLGVSVSGPDGFDYATAFDRADAALLQAKRGGRDRVVVAESPPAAPASATTGVKIV